MKYLLSGTEMKRWEKQMMEKYKIPSILLMERAAASVVKELCKNKYDLHKILVVCGTGNNGGDGLAVARMLKLKEHRVEVCLAGECEKLSADARIQFDMYEAIQGEMVTEPDYEEYTVIVDALLGIGCNREITGDKAVMIQKINASGVPVVSVDVPSGISSDTGKVCNIAVKADVTVTFFAEKLGMILYPGRDYCGEIVVEKLEMPFTCTEDCQIITYTEEDLKRLPKRMNDSHKGTYGKVLVIAGSQTISGAAFLSAAAAYRMGAGLVKIYTPEENKIAMQTLLPEALLEIYDRKQLSGKQLADAVNWADVIVAGPGLGTDEAAKNILCCVLEQSRVPLVIDADGLNLLAKMRDSLHDAKCEVILTPHILEMARLAGETKEYVKEHTLELAREFTETYPVTLVLKDARTVAAKSQEYLYVNTSGNSGMATGGSGDVLAGMLGGLLAQGMKCVDAARLAVYLHGKAGDMAAKSRGVYGMTATDLLDGITEVTNV